MKTLLLSIFIALPSAALGAPWDLSAVPGEVLVQVTDMYDGVAAEEAAAGAHLSFVARYDGDLARRLWNNFAPVYGFQDWGFFGPGVPYRRIVLELKGRRLVLKSRHPHVELNPNLVFTAQGVELLNGRSRAEVLQAGDPEYLKKREAFDAIVAACTAAKARYELSERRVDEHNRAQQKKFRKKGSVFSGLMFYLLLFFFAGIAWLFPAWGMARKVAGKGGSPLGWALALCALSPPGWVVWLGWPHVRGWMPALAILAAYGLYLAAKFIPVEEGKPDPAAARALPLAAVIILAYGSWTIYAGVQYRLWNMARGSGESATIGNLSGLRASVTVYAADNEGRLPAGLAALIPKYLSEFAPTHAVATLDGVILHAPSGKVRVAPEPDDAGGWGYSAADGRVYINCTHKDLRGEKRLCDY